MSTNLTFSPYLFFNYSTRAIISLKNSFRYLKTFVCLKPAIIQLVGMCCLLHQRINLCVDYQQGVFQTFSDSGYRSVYPHFEDLLKALYFRDHRAAAQCDTSLAGFDHQIASVSVIRLPRWIPPSRSGASLTSKGVTLLLSTYVAKHSRLTFTL